MLHPAYQLIPYLRDQLDSRGRATVEHHLAGCASCRQEISNLSATLARLRREIEQMPVPDWNRYRAELRRKLSTRVETPQRRWQVNWVWGALAASAVAALLKLSFSMRSHQFNPSNPADNPAPNTPLIDQVAMADTMSHTDIGLFRDYPVVEHLDMLENYDLIEHLDELSPAAQTNATTHQL